MDSSNVNMDSGNVSDGGQPSVSSAPAGAPGSSAPNFPGNSPAPMVEIKLFVGRVPPSMDEDRLKPIFEEFGEVSEVVIIRDKQTNKHKNSAFVKMGSVAFADAAIRGLSNVRTLDSSMGAMTVKYATGEAEKIGLTSSAAEPGVDQAKLFIGSVPKTLNEDGIKEFFSAYGNVEEVFVMKDNVTNQGRGCAFVKFSFKEEALHAIKSLNGKHTFSGCSRPVEVRFAETRAQRQQQQMNVRGNRMDGDNRMGGRTDGRVDMRGGLGMMRGGAGGSMASPGGTGALGMGGAGAVGIPNNNNPRQAGRWKEYFTQDGRAYYHNELTNTTTWERPPEFSHFPPPPAPGTLVGGGVSGLGMMGGGGASGRGGSAGGSAGNNDDGDSAGPPGANIFVFHVPNEWSYYDLFNHFSVFGNVISARVATDRSTGRNRGFAFVSYDNIEAASTAVNAMNGFVVNGKRLKVTIKKGEEQFVQHLLQNNNNQNGGNSNRGGGNANGGGQGNWSGGAYTAGGGYAVGGAQRFAPY